MPMKVYYSIIVKNYKLMRSNVLKFYIVNKPWNIGTYTREYPCLELLTDSWDDYGYETTFTLYYLKRKGIKLELGVVKILSLEEKSTIKVIPPDFEKLENLKYCSLGQSIKYYRQLSKLPEEVYKEILISLQDIVFNKDIYEKFPNKEGINDSLFRSSEANKVFKSAFDKYFLEKEIENEIFNFSFKYHAPYSSIENTINFDFEESSFLPNRINILVGKNGTGKTQLLSRFADALCGQSKKTKELFSPPQIPLFSKVIAVSFSAFDDFRKPYEKKERLINTSTDSLDDEDTTLEDEVEALSEKRKLNNYVYCGIQDDKGKTLSLKELKQHGKKNLLKILEREENSNYKINYLDKWKDILLNIEIPSKYLDDPSEIFNSSLSSGQSILVSIITEVIANIEDESILLFDEPELHLHPNAVSNLVRMLYQLLEEFNSYAIISTHSPLFIQEIPSNYINKLERTEEDLLLISKLSIETFGENISAIVNEVFNVREVESNYKSLLKKSISTKSFEQITELFPNGLSLHAMTYLNIIYNQKSKDRQ